MISKKSTTKNNFHFKVFEELKIDTNLTRIKNKLKISKNNLNYYLRQLRDDDLITKKGRGWYEVKKKSENSTKYGRILLQDISRGHGFIWKVDLPKNIKSWNNRIEILKKNNVNYKLVGAMKDTPRIKALGRKVWLCNNHLRIFEMKGKSYYGDNAIEARKKACRELLDIVRVLENKLQINLGSPIDFDIGRDHYALIKNDLAKDCNKRGEILRIRDEGVEWLLVDDSLGAGGELETIGKKALVNNLMVQKWWNNMKDTKFKVTPDFVLNTMNGIQQNQLEYAENMVTHVAVLKKLGKAVDQLTTAVKRQNVREKLNEEQKTLGSY